MSINQMISAAVAAGIQFRLEGTAVKVVYAPDHQQQVAPILRVLREHKAEVAMVLRSTGPRIARDRTVSPNAPQLRLASIVSARRHAHALFAALQHDPEHG